MPPAAVLRKCGVVLVSCSCWSLNSGCGVGQCRRAVGPTGAGGEELDRVAVVNVIVRGRASCTRITVPAALTPPRALLARLAAAPHPPRPPHRRPVPTSSVAPPPRAHLVRRAAATYIYYAWR
jgi:hypothetical protein